MLRDRTYYYIGELRKIFPKITFLRFETVMGSDLDVLFSLLTSYLADQILFIMFLIKK